MPEIQAQIRLPYVEKIHEVIHAYLRTSLQGEWEIDAAAPPDPFIARYRRGARSWMTTFGFRGRWTEYEFVYPSIIAQGKSQLPVLLKIVIRPSPHSTLLNLCFTVRPAYPTGRNEGHILADQKTLDVWLAEIVSGDTQGLVDYLEEFYSLKDKPELILPIGN